MIEEIITEMESLFRKDVFAEKTTFYFSVDDAPITVIIDPQCYLVQREKPVRQADCSCKTDAEMFRKIWYDGYRPGIMDFLSAAIRCDAPLMLPQFLEAFGK